MGPLAELLDVYDYLEASNARNKAYALLGLADTPEDGRELPIDYGKSTAAVFCDVLAFWDVHPDVSVVFSNRLARLLDFRARDMVAEPQASDAARTARGWLVGAVEDELGHLEDDQLQDFGSRLKTVTQAPAVMHEAVNNDLGGVSNADLKWRRDGRRVAMSLTVRGSPRPEGHWRGLSNRRER